ncbi:Ent-kaurene oxidase [Rhypophila decipiens]|uniref:Ent-kaurene oxidase n=1 Tax=Rhypophila decipiens TaxID=261697 RepID=A0AAN7B3E6_9PEZI|nr:Ent-kaurene oxidase [Rhypophila decipiens]
MTSAFPVQVQLFATLISAVLVTGYVLSRRRRSWSRDWKTGKPTIGTRSNRWFDWERASLRSFNMSKEWSLEGYRKFGRFNSPFIMPCVDRGPVVIIPPKQLKTVYGLPDKVLDMQKTSTDGSMQAKYTIADQGVVSRPFQMNIVRNQMTRNLDVLTPVIAAELEASFARLWGTDRNKWKEFSVWDSCLDLITGASNAAFCGEPLCKDAAFLKSLRDHGMITFLGALLISSTPLFFRPVTGTLIGWACEYQFLRTKWLCLPFIKKRLANTARARNDPNFCWEAPVDGLQWLIEESYATQDPTDLDPVRVTRRLLYINDISLHSTSFTMQNVIPDIYTYDGGDDGEKNTNTLVEALREEVSTVLAEAGGFWTRNTLQKLKLVDATVRESMRLTPFASVGLPRTVIDPHGISLHSPGGKFHIPPGTVIATALDGIHRDPVIYPSDDDPNCFNPFRDAPQFKSATSLDDGFLAFGYGRHACPGRFFALNEMKIMVAHMVLNYDIEYVGKRPELTSVVWLKVPYHQGKVRVRRRQL